MKFTKLIPLVLCAALFLNSCDDDDDNMVNVPSVVETNFTKQYPDAAAVSWEKDNEQSVSYLKAEFQKDGVEYEAWYTYDGTWFKTEIDYNDPLPLSVTSQLRTVYPSYYIDDVKWVETPQQNFFEIEMKKDQSEVEVYILANGTIIFINDSEREVPVVVEHRFSELYPETSVNKWEKEGQLLKAEFIHNNTESEAWFTYDGTWVKTSTEFKERLPEAVDNYIHANYPGYQKEDIQWVETPITSYFEIELENGSVEVLLAIYASGELVRADRQ